jgi:hypothetical protein
MMMLVYKMRYPKSAENVHKYRSIICSNLEFDKQLDRLNSELFDDSIPTKLKTSNNE